ncbi:hypothetical protein Hanom_Chr11g01014161 [Helianthus anomalus]
MNNLDVKVGGEMSVRILPEGKIMWLEQIRDYFHHPSEESLAAYTHRCESSCYCKTKNSVDSR